LPAGTVTCSTNTKGQKKKKERKKEKQYQVLVLHTAKESVNKEQWRFTLFQILSASVSKMALRLEASPNQNVQQGRRHVAHQQRSPDGSIKNKLP